MKLFLFFVISVSLLFAGYRWYCKKLTMVTSKIVIVIVVLCTIILLFLYRKELDLRSEIIFPSDNRDSYYHISQKKQIVYQFDRYRYLALQGDGCEGLYWYHDIKRGIKTRINFYIARDNLAKFTLIHPSEKFIVIPLNDLSGFITSFDYGHSFTQMDNTKQNRSFYYITLSQLQNKHEMPLADDIHVLYVGKEGAFLSLKDGNTLFSRVSGQNRNDFLLRFFPNSNGNEQNQSQVYAKQEKAMIAIEKQHSGWKKIVCDVNKSQKASTLFSLLQPLQ